MKRFLSILLAVAMVFSLALPALAVGPGAAGKGDIVILHSNDVHGAIEGYARMAMLKQLYTTLGAEVFVFDAGDFIQGDPAVSMDQGATAVKLMDMVGYDAAATGNHEYDYGYENLKDLESAAGFSILAANVTVDGKPAFSGHRLFTAKNGVKLGVFGLTTPETATKLHPAKVAGLKFAGGEELYAIAQAEVDALKAQGADYIICLGHLGVDQATAATANRSVDLLAHVKGIDVLLDGHSHTTQAALAGLLGEECRVEDCLVASTGSKFESIGVVTIAADGAITAESQPAAEVDAGLGTGIAREIAAIQDKLEAEYGAVFASSLVDLNGDRAPGNRTQETNHGDLVADAILWYAKSEGGLEVDSDHAVALLNGGSIRAPIAAGDLTKKDVNTALPYSNTVCTVYVTGSTLLEALEASTFAAPEPVGGFPQVSGLCFRVDTSKEYDQGERYRETTYYAPKSINRVTIDSVNGQPFDPGATYAVVTNDFVAAGGDSYYAFAAAGRIMDSGTLVDEAVMAYISRELDGVIPAAYAQPQGRIIIGDAPAAPEVPETPAAPAAPAVDPMEDLDPAAWYYPAAKTMVDQGIMTGTGAGFEPGATVTRATVFQTLYNLAGKPGVTNKMATFPDAQGKWYESAARWAEQEGLTTGTGDGFAGDRAVTRGELVTILWRYAQSRGMDMTAGEEINLLAGFYDAELVTVWSVNAFRWSVGAKVLSGKASADGALLAPDDTATRAELAQVLSNFTALPLPAPAEEGTVLAGKSVSLDRNGAVNTDLTFQALADAGFALGDILQITVGDKKIAVQAPWVEDYAQVDLGREAVVVSDGAVQLGIHMGDFATAYGVGSRGDSIFSYEMTETPVTLSLAQKGGYAEDLALRSLTGLGSDRVSYPSDQAFANFREVALGDIAPGTLYRSASPIQPGMAQAPYADALLDKAGIKTIVDMADCRAQAPEYAGFAATAYAKVHDAGGTVYLNMGSDMYAQVGLDDLRNGLDFMAGREGPYLIHSTWGKDRAGHLLFLLEALMGASVQEVVADYMGSYENLYGLQPGSEAWSAIAAGTIELEVTRLMGAADFSAATVKAAGGGLAQAAETYLTGTVGLSQDQVDALKANLSGK